MKKQLLKFVLVICVALLAGCAKTALVSFAPQKSETYKKAKTIFVVLNTGETYEMRDFSVRGDSLVGTRVLRKGNWKIVGQRASKIELAEILTIQFIESENQSGSFFGGGLAFGLGLTVALGTLWLLL